MQSSNFTTVPENGNCTLYNETEMSVECTKYLQKYANCLNTSTSTEDVATNVYISGFPNYTAIKEVFGHLRLVYGAHQQCLANLKPLICLHFIHLCDMETGIMIQPSITQCEHVKRVCNKELKTIRSNFPMISESVDAIISKCALSSPLNSETCTPR